MPRISLLLVILLCIPSESMAHKSSDAFVQIKFLQENVALELELSIRDFLNILHLDLDGNREVTWRELQEASDDIDHYIQSKLTFTNQTELCQLLKPVMKVSRHSDGNYIAMSYEISCQQYDKLKLSYYLFFDVDLDHRALVTIASKTQTSNVLSPMQPSMLVRQIESPWHAVKRFIVQGIWHIWLGFDHVLFLLSLLLGSLLNTVTSSRDGNSRYIRDIVVIVSIFTLAHTLSLTAVILGGFMLPVDWVEWTIALTVLLVSFNNLVSVIKKHHWQLTFLFGLIHGMGFANVLNDMKLQQAVLFRSLLSFNVGVELGQLMLIGAIIPVALYLQRNLQRPRRIWQLGSLAIVFMSGFWTLERSLPLLN